MNLIPTVGTDDISFGMSELRVVQRFGQPVSKQQLLNIDGYPKDRRILDYAEYSFLINPYAGLLSITVDISADRLTLWGRDILLFSPEELQIYIRTMGYSTSIECDLQWDECHVTAIECGLIAYFCEDKLESIEIDNPSWRNMHIRARQIGS
jgi:hypothetical protein